MFNLVLTIIEKNTILYTTNRYCDLFSNWTTLQLLMPDNRHKSLRLTTHYSSPVHHPSIIARKNYFAYLFWKYFRRWLDSRFRFRVLSVGGKSRKVSSHIAKSPVNLGEKWWEDKEERGGKRNDFVANEYFLPSEWWTVTIWHFGDASPVSISRRLESTVEWLVLTVESCSCCSTRMQSILTSIWF